MKPLEKPNLSIATVWIQNNDTLPAKVAQYLADLMPKATNPEKRRAFLEKVGHTVGLLNVSGTTTASDMVKQLDQLANASRALLHAISLLNDDTARCLEAHALTCAVMRTDGVPQLPERIATQRIASMEGIRSQAWDGAAALETASRFAQSQVEPQAGIKDSKVRAKQLVRRLAMLT